MKKLYFLICMLFSASYLLAQTIETFETETLGSTTFTDNGKSFSITSQAQGPFDIQASYPGTGWNGTSADNVYIDNDGFAAFNMPVQFTISTSDASAFTLKSMYLFLSTHALDLNVSGSVTITGKLGGVTQFTASGSAPFNTSMGVNNGFTFFDMSAYGGQNNSSTFIDQFVISTTGNIGYVALDALRWQPNPCPTINSTGSQTNVSCNGGANGSASVFPSGGTPPYTYSWSPSGGTASTTTGRPAGNYTVTITDANGCIGTRAFTITQPAAFSVATAKNDVSCFGGSNGAAAVSVSGGTAPYSYSWSPSGGTGSLATGLVAGTYTITITDANACQTTRNFTINQPAASVSGSTVIINTACNGGSNGAINLTPTGGTGPYTFLWNGGATTEDRTGLTAGNYSVIITDVNGCTGTVNVTVNQPASAISGSTVVTNVACNGGTTGAINLTPSGGTGPYTFNWGGGITTEDRTGLAAGNYSVTITDANGCTGTVNATVTQPSVIQSGTVVSNIWCHGQTTGAINLNVIGGTPPYDFNWDDGITTEDRTNLSAGTYTVTITDSNGCTRLYSYTVNQPSAPVSGTTVITNIACSGGSNGAINLTPTGGTPPYSYNWGGGITTEDRTGLTAGSYSVTITDANNCSNTVNATVTQPASAISGTTVVTNVACNGGSNGAINLTPTGGTGPYTFNWGGGITTEDRTGLVAGNYSVVITDANSCTGTVNVTVGQPASAISGTTVVTNVACNGGSNGAINLTPTGGTPPYTYNWGGGITTEDRINLSAGSYSVTITDVNGCTGTVNVTVAQPASAISGTTVVTNVACNGGSNGAINLTPTGGTGPYTFLWNGGATTEDRTGLTAGNYFVVITDANGCTGTVNATVGENSDGPVISAITPLVYEETFNQMQSYASGSSNFDNWVQFRASIDLTAEYTYLTVSGSQLPGGITITDPVAINQIATALQNGISMSVTSGGNTWRVGIGCSVWSVDAVELSVNADFDCGCNTGFSIRPQIGNENWGGLGGTTCTSVTQTLRVEFGGSSITHVSCNGGSDGVISTIVTEGVAPYTYVWSPGNPTGQGTNTISGLISGTYNLDVTDANGCTTSNSFTVTEPAVLVTLADTQTNVSCNGGSNGSATVAVTGGTGAYTYSWAPMGGTAATATGLAAGTYTVTVTDENGCTATQSFTITEPAALVASASSQTNVSCNGGSNGSATVAVTGGTGPYTYSWSPSGGTAATATGLATGTYTVTVTDANGCMATQSFTITQPSAITATQSQTNVLCNGGATGSASVNVSGGTGPYTYLWAPSGGTAATASGLAVGNYTVTITDANGCQTIRNFTITQPSALSATTSQVNATCISPGQASVTPFGGTSPHTYLWSPSGATTQTATNLSAGNHSVVITDANGCSIVRNFTITTTNTLTATTAQNNVLCNGSSTGSATVIPSSAPGPFTYVWSPSGGNAATATGLTAGNYTVTITSSTGCSRVESFTITEPAALVASASSQTNITCNGGSNGSATVAVTGGTGAYTYSWSPSGGTAATATGLSAGTYTVTVTDANGCIATQSFTITQPAALVASASSQTNIACNGGSNGSATVAVTGGTSGYTYSWSPSGGTAATATGLSAGTYTVTVTDANGCTATQSFTITEPAALVASASAQTNVSCNGGSNGSATVAVTGGTGAYTYSWAPSGGTSATATGLAAGTYTVTITDANGCTATQSFTITEPAALVASASSQTNIACNSGATGAATVTVTGGTGAYTYSWSPSGGTSATATGLAAGTYTVTVTDENGCTATQSFTITQPAALVASASSQTNVSCNGGSNGSATVAVTGGTGAYTYSWAPSGGTAATATGLAAGTYTVTVTDENGCTATQSFTITQPAALVASASAQTNVSCNGGSNGSATVAVTGGTGAYTYSWSPSGGTAATATGLAAGTYTVTVTDENGCTATQSFTITEPSTLVASASAQTNVSCNGGSNGSATVAVTGGTGAYTYSWAPSGGTAATATGLTAGTYTVTVTDENGCTATQSFTITEPAALIATLASGNVSCPGASDGTATVAVTGGTGAYTYSWAPMGGTAATATGLTAGTYTVTVTDENGCMVTQSIEVLTTPDITAPVADIAILTDVVVQCEVTAGMITAPTATDNCAGIVTATTADALTYNTQGTYTITWTYNDGNGNTTTQTQTVIVNDTTNPVVNVATLPSITNYCSVLPAEITAPTATDNCAGTVTATTSDALEYTAEGTYTITWSFDDGNGNTTTQQQTINVVASPLEAVTFADADVVYNTGIQTIEVENLPAGAGVTYSTTPSTGTDNGAVNAGIYTVTAVVTPPAEAFNCDPVTLTATLTIDRAPQIIAFDPIPVKNLENDPDFQLNATATSGLPVYYTYTFTAPQPPATVTPEGFVDMLTSGEVMITAHQDGNENYLPAESVQQLLVIESSNAFISYITVGDEMYENPSADIYYLIECADSSAESVEVNLVTEVNATVTPGHQFTIATPQPGIYTQEVTVTSQDGTVINTYTITVEKRFNFFDIVEQKFNNVLLVNNNPQTNGGYKFMAYEWYRNDQLIGNGQYYSAGDDSTDLLDTTAEYRVVMTTIDGEILQTCIAQIELENVSRLYPNPAQAGRNITIEAGFPADELQNMQISVYSVSGSLITTLKSSSNISQVQLPAAMEDGTYLVLLESPNLKKALKVIVRK